LETTQQKDKKMKTINVTTIKNEKTITGSITAQMSTATIVSGLGTRTVDELVLTIVPDNDKEKYFYMVCEDPKEFLRIISETINPTTF